VGIFVASGDAGWTGSTPDYPSGSKFVHAVGGTKLVKSSNARGWTEGAWSSGGSSCSNVIAKPSYEGVSNNVCSKRATVDLAAVGDPATGLAVYNANAGGFIVVGGTSASCPLVAGIFALYSLPSKGADTAAYEYSHTTSFFDVTSGSNGCSTIM